MAHASTSSPNNDPRQFGIRVFITARGLARGRYERGDDAGAHDMAMLVFLQFWSNPTRWMATYTPEVFAAVSLRKRAEDWRRSERIQRGQGAHLTERNGARVARREIGSLDELTDRIGDITTNGHDFADSVAAQVDVKKAMAMLSPLQRTLVVHVDIEGYTVVETAQSLGKSRAYCQRELGKAREFIREYVVAA
ncbi:MAG: sigma-70 family RNA polymerase sigma factor [Actinomycetes bacterium]